MERTCKYVNCDAPIGGNPLKKYCCRNHKTYDRIYTKRFYKKKSNDRKLMEQAIKSMEQIVNIDPMVLELYNKIYNK